MFSLFTLARSGPGEVRNATLLYKLMIWGRLRPGSGDQYKFDYDCVKYCFDHALQDFVLFLFRKLGQRLAKMWPIFGKKTQSRAKRGQSNT